MRTHTKWFLCLCVLAVWGLGGGRLTFAQSQPDPVFELTILYTTDVNGQFRDFRCRRRGVAGYQHEAAKRDISNLLFQVNRVRKDIVGRYLDPTRNQDAKPLLFNTGDNLGISLAARFLLEFEDLSGVEFIAEVFRRFSYDLIGLGNHEFSVPNRKKLQQFIERAVLEKDLRFSAANLEAPADHPIAKLINKQGPDKVKAFVFEQTFRRTYKTKDSTGKEVERTFEKKIKVGAFHLVPNELEKKVTSSIVKGMKFSDPGSKASEVATWLRDEKKVDVVIMLSHLEGSKSNGAKVKEVLGSASGIDLVITNELRDGEKATFTGTFDRAGKGVYIVGGAAYGSQLGRVRLRVKKPKDDEAGKVLSAQIDSIPLKDDKYDTELRRDLIKWESSYCRRWGQPLGDGRIREKYNMSQENFAKYMLNSIRELTRAEVAIINRGAIRKRPFGDSGLSGYVTKDDLYRALPFNEKIEILRVKGSVLSGLSNSSDKFYFAGFDGSNVNGRSIEESQVYTVATITYVANGREGGFEKENVISRVPFVYSNAAPEHIRDMMIHHFSTNGFRRLPKAPAPAAPESMEDKDKKNFKPKNFSKEEIPFTGDFVNLADRAAFKWTGRVELNFRSIFLGPINIGTFYQQKDTLSGGFYEKYAGTIAAETKFQVDTRAHLWVTTFNLNYGIDVSRQWSPGPPAEPSRELIFQESDDKFSIRTEYSFRYFEALFPGKQRWFYTNPFVEAQFDIELTRSSRPDLTPEQAFNKLGVTDIFQNTEVKTKLGFSFQPFRDYLFNQAREQEVQKLQEKYPKRGIPSWQAVDLQIKLAFAVRRQLALFLQTKPGSVSAVNTDFNIGFSAEYKLNSFRLGMIGKTPITWDSGAEYLFTVVVAPNKPELGTLFVHDLAWDNKISVQIVGGLKLSLGMRLIVYSGFFQRDPNNTASKLEQGPIAFRLDPNISLSFDWGARGQAY
ncbi:MAG: bifunctional metallophosphatase/5'-nucleotidase [Myxococcales bacterium]|nr:bifunctional metallophosphatase/5'-nucleotidase [Myxococcales bacterium]MCB9644807.1 bifunctional metallophosphatase/5'-nucleotidase [Myxococcales bacterium]